MDCHVTQPEESTAQGSGADKLACEIGSGSHRGGVVINEPVANEELDAAGEGGAGKDDAMVEGDSVWTDGDIVSHILKFTGSGTFRFVAPINKTCWQSYKLVNKNCITTLRQAVTSVYRATICVAEGGLWDSRICFYAAEGGHLEVLKWARANGCDWDWRTCSNAAKGGK